MCIAHCLFNNNLKKNHDRNTFFLFFHYHLQPFSCPPSYSFRNEMTLANSLDTFIDTLNNLGVSSNIDFPEGGFEALLQVAACYKKLGKLMTKLILPIGPKARATS